LPSIIEMMWSGEPSDLRVVTAGTYSCCDPASSADSDDAEPLCESIDTVSCIDFRNVGTSSGVTRVLGFLSHAIVSSVAISTVLSGVSSAICCPGIRFILDMIIEGGDHAPVIGWVS
jgi:hypothetical protein